MYATDSQQRISKSLSKQMSPKGIKHSGLPNRNRLPKLKREKSPETNKSDESYAKSKLKRRSESNPKTTRTSSTIDGTSVPREHKYDGSLSPLSNMNKLEIENYRSRQFLKKLQLPEPELFNKPTIMRSLSNKRRNVIIFGSPSTNTPVLTNDAPSNFFELNFKRRLKNDLVSKIYCNS